jgi:hypothetical protein
MGYMAAAVTFMEERQPSAHHLGERERKKEKGRKQKSKGKRKREREREREREQESKRGGEREVDKERK